MSYWRHGDAGKMVDRERLAATYHEMGRSTAVNLNNMTLDGFLLLVPGYDGAFLSDCDPLYWYADKDIFTFRPRLVK